MAKYILAIETSCDETSAAVVADGRTVLANEISSQVDLHRIYGGVVPEIASRRHIQNIVPVVKAAVHNSGIQLQSLAAIAVTNGPGLVGALLVGLSMAKALAYGLDLPLIGVNHIAAHIYANFLTPQPPSFPLLCLVVSGGHTELVLMHDHLHFERLGHTRDDAAGEAFDKIARRLGLGYPGGPAIDSIARQGDHQAFDFPRAYLDTDSLDFSFSGLKSAVINEIHRFEQKGEQVPVADIAASFQQAVVDVLVDKAEQAARKHCVKHVCLAGGVAANSSLRAELRQRLSKYDITLTYPAPILCTDNAAMVAAAGYYYLDRGYTAPLSLNAVPGQSICG